MIKKDFMDSDGEFRQITIRQLADTLPIVHWKSYIEAALGHNPSLEIRPSTRVYVPDMDKMMKLGSMVEKLSVRDRANLLIWRMFITFSNKFFATGERENWYGRTQKERCITEIERFFPNAVNDLTIAKNVDEKTAKGIKTIFHNLQKEFEEIIDSQDWMSRRTKKNAKDLSLIHI